MYYKVMADVSEAHGNELLASRLRNNPEELTLVAKDGVWLVLVRSDEDVCCALHPTEDKAISHALAVGEHFLSSCEDCAVEASVQEWLHLPNDREKLKSLNGLVKEFHQFKIQVLNLSIWRESDPIWDFEK